ncbi:NAD(P)-dependent alcohol dehydrogenase [Microbacterium sp. A84]|uniref:NAD(P)-dependent alcohol dehydrogenase n=1 Tax=Microbacterium sp. A84 TaxID=3450715 RepID=UPI003F432D21
MMIPTTMRASQLQGPLVLEVRSIPVPVARAEDVIVRIEAVGLCGSDVHFYQHGRVGDLVVEHPLVLGHEASGVIVSAGSGVDPRRIGERVAIEPQRHCRECRYCLDGRYNLCVAMEFASAPPVDGALAEYMCIPSIFAHPIPGEMSFVQATFVEPLSVGLAAARKAGIAPGMRVLVAGAGPIGILTAAAAKIHGADTVVLVDPQEQRLEAARQTAAFRTARPLDLSDETFDVFVDASGAAAAIDDGLRRLSAGGIAVLVGMGSARYDLDVFLVQSKELRLEGLFRYANTWPTAIHMIASGAVKVDHLVAAMYGLDDVQAAMERNGDADAIKLIVCPLR